MQVEPVNFLISVILLLWEKWGQGSAVYREMSSCFPASIELELKQNFVSQKRNQNALDLNDNMEKKNFHFVISVIVIS